MGLGFWLITMSAVLLLAGVIPITPLSAEALTSKDIEDLENLIDTIKEDITKTENLIESKDKSIKELYEKRETSYQAWITLDQQKMQSWEALAAVGPAKESVDTIESTISTETRQLGTLYAKKADLTNELSQLLEQLEQDKYIFSIINRPLSDYSTTKHIGVVLSQTCIDMIKSGINDGCPTYEDLYSLDTSDQTISGKFEDNNGFFSRSEPTLKNSWRLYDTDDTPRIFVDPPKGMAERIKLIKIESHLPEYFTIQDMKLDNNIRTWNESRYVDNCRQATISGELYLTLLPDTIFLFHNNCEISDFNDTKYEKMPYTDLPLDQTQYWKDKMWLEESKQKCKGLCFEY